MARSASSHYPDRIFRGTWTSGGPEGHPRTSGDPSRIQALVWARPSGQQNWNLIRSCRHAPTSRQRPSLKVRASQAAPPPGQPGRPWVRLGRSTAPARPPATPARAAPSLGGVFVGGRTQRGAACWLSLRGRVLGPAAVPPAREARTEESPARPSSRFLSLLRLHSHAALYLEWVIPACFPRAASRSPKVEH